MSTTAEIYQLNIMAAPYAGGARDHLVEYLISVLTGAIDVDRLVLGVDKTTERVTDHDVTTVRIRFRAADPAEASAIAREAVAKIGERDEHWRIVGEPAIARLTNL